MKTLLCHDFLTEQEREGLSDPDRSRTISMPDHTVGRHLECGRGHKLHLGKDGEKWPCDCCARDK
jgi:hypothetical protein